jgi:hypothetical protein
MIPEKAGTFFEAMWTREPLIQGLVAEMQGPERHLVGDVAKRPQLDVVEEVEPGRRGVGEIGGAVELLDILERHLNEARGKRDRYSGFQSDPWFYGLSCKVFALEELQKELLVTISQRSDLSNADVKPSPL